MLLYTIITIIKYAFSEKKGDPVTTKIHFSANYGDPVTRTALSYMWLLTALP